MSDMTCTALELVEDAEAEVRTYQRLFGAAVVGAVASAALIATGAILGISQMITAETVSGFAVPGSFTLLGCVGSAAYLYSEPLRHARSSLRESQRLHRRAKDLEC